MTEGPRIYTYIYFNFYMFIIFILFCYIFILWNSFKSLSQNPKINVRIKRMIQIWTTIISFMRISHFFAQNRLFQVAISSGHLEINFTTQHWWFINQWRSLSSVRRHLSPGITTIQNIQISYSNTTESFYRPVSYEPTVLQTIFS